MSSNQWARPRVAPADGVVAGTPALFAGTELARSTREVRS